MEGSSECPLFLRSSLTQPLVFSLSPPTPASQTPMFSRDEEREAPKVAKYCVTRLCDLTLA